MRRPALQFLAASIALGGCSAAVTPTAPAPSPAGSAMPLATVAATAATTAIPTAVPTTPSVTRPPSTQSWPIAFDIEMSGAYWSAPPFRVPFAITIDTAGWYSGHLHDTFTDLQRFDGMTAHQFPNRMLGFGDPDHVRSADGDIDVAGLTPGAALDLIAARTSLKSSNRAPQELFGLDGARLDLHSATESNPLFGNGRDNFGLGPELDVRLVLLPLHGRLLAVVVLGAPGDLDAAWDQALPMLRSVDLAAGT